jgi:anti-anti-sigma factor
MYSDRRSEVLAFCELAWSDHGLVVTGEIDAANADALAERVRDLIADGGTVIDLAAVGFFGVAGARMLLSAGSFAHGTDRIVHVICSPAVWRVLYLCGMTDIPGLVLDCSTPFAGNTSGEKS